jgi:hypothetical protein
MISRDDAIVILEAGTMKKMRKSRESTRREICTHPWCQSAIVAVILLGMASGNTALADNVKILDATTEVQANGLYAFSVTLQHPDEGWSHYADRWEVVGSDGKVLGERILFHPHESNVPFTRSLANVKIPLGTLNVAIRANCSVDGLTPYTREVELPPR